MIKILEGITVTAKWEQYSAFTQLKSTAGSISTSTRMIEYCNPIPPAMLSPPPNATHLRPHNFAFVCAFLSTGSIFVAFMTSPLIFNFPDMNSRCAWVLPATILPKSSSDNDSVTAAGIRTRIQAVSYGFGRRVERHSGYERISRRRECQTHHRPSSPLVLRLSQQRPSP